MYIRFHIKQILQFSLLQWHFEGYHLPSHIESSFKKNAIGLGVGKLFLWTKTILLIFWNQRFLKILFFFPLFYHCFSHLELCNKIIALLFISIFFKCLFSYVVSFFNILNLTILLLLWGYLLIHIYGVRQ